MLKIGLIISLLLGLGTFAAVSAQGGDILKEKCAKCHSLETTTSQVKDAEGWNKTVETMVNYGAQLTAEEKKSLIAYLADTYGSVAEPKEAPTTGNSCVDCHKKKDVISTLPGYQRYYYAEWAGSIHGMEGVTCEKCMGGDPAQVEKDPAHKGVMISNNPESPVFYLNLPRTCGKCHPAVFDQFSRSKHYRNLEGHNLAPDCVTCHGSHTVSLVEPLVLSEKCKVCHNAQTGIKPRIASEARDVLFTAEEAEDALSQAQTAVKIARKNGVDTTQAEQSLQEAKDKLEESKMHWHRFDIGNFRSELNGAIGSADRAAALANESLGAPAATKGACGPTALILLAVVPLLAVKRRR